MSSGPRGSAWVFKGPSCRSVCRARNGAWFGFQVSFTSDRIMNLSPIGRNLRDRAITLNLEPGTSNVELDVACASSCNDVREKVTRSRNFPEKQCDSELTTPSFPIRKWQDA